ncbi:hypothetical protein HMPREF2641_10460, partial [Lactobacillus sp. HMSC068B07]
TRRLLRWGARYGSKSELVPLDGDGPLLAIATEVLTCRPMLRGTRVMVSESILAQRPNIRTSSMVADAYFLFLQREQCDCMPKNHLDSLIPNNPLSIRHPNT